MTFTEIVTEISARLNLSSSEATARVGRLVNQVYREVTTEINMNTSRQTTVTTTATIGSQEVTFSAIEKVQRVWYDDATGNHTVLREVTLDELRKETAGTEDSPSKYCVRRMGNNTVTIRMDVSAETAFNISADGVETVSDLSGSVAPAFPESFHPILICGVLRSEYRKINQRALAKDEEADYIVRLSALRYFIVKSNYLKIQQGGAKELSRGSSSGGGGSSNLGQTAYSQTGLITFDRDPEAPFAVTSGSAKVDNLDADLIDGLNSTAFIRAVATPTDNAIVRFDGAGGTLVQNSGITIADSASGTLAGSNSGDVTLAGQSYLSVLAQVITAGLVNLASHVTSRLPFANLIAGTAASKLIGTSSSGAGDFQEITLGSGLSMTGSTLSASAAVAGSDTQVTFNDGGVFGADAGLTYNKTTDALTVAGQLIVSGAAAGQIVFPATQNASTNLNTLDDYQEDDWVPVVGGSGGTSGQTYTRQIGRYVKVGKKVTATFDVLFSNKGTITTSLQLQGLPFTVENTANIFWISSPIYFADMVSTIIWMVVRTAPNTTTALFDGITAAAISTTGGFATADVGNTTRLSGTLTYMATT